MPYRNAEFNWLDNVIRPSLGTFYDSRDRELVVRDVHERSIVNAICRYMLSSIEQAKNNNPWIDNLSLDVEYNRNFEDQKRLYIKCTQCEVNNCYVSRKFIQGIQGNASNPFAIPDMIIHSRGNNEDNQVMIEIKKSTATRRQILYDYRKISFFTCQRGHDVLVDYKYRLGFFIRLGVDSYEIDTFVDGRKAHNIAICL